MAYSLFLAEALFHISRHTVLSLADLANFAENCLRRECTKCKDLRHLRYLRATHISACIINLSQISLISQIIIASGEGSQRKDLRHLRHLRENYFRVICEKYKPNSSIRESCTGFFL